MASKGVYKWSFIERVTVSSLNFGGNIILARLLTQADFGLLAMIGIFISIATDLSDCGMSDGLIHKLKPTRKDYSTVFISNAVMGAFFGSLFFFLAPQIAEYFGHGELIWIMRIHGICFFFRTLSYVQETRLRKLLCMKHICIVRISGTVISLALGIFLAINGFGYWALVSTQIFISFFLFVGFLIASRWFPGFVFEFSTFKGFFKYGYHLMLAFLGEITSKNINTFVLGKAYTSSSLSGIYFVGTKLANVPFSISESSLNSPFFAVASNEADKQKRKELILQMFSFLVGCNALILFFMLAISRPAVEFLYGLKWDATVPVLRILVAFEFFNCVKKFFQTVFKIKGITNVIKNLAFVEIIIQLSLLMIFYKDGLEAVALTQVGGVLSSILIYVFIYCKTIEINFNQFIKYLLSAICIPAICGCVSFFLNYTLGQIIHLNAFMSCVIVTVSFLILFVAIGEIFKSNLYISIKSKIIK